MEHTPGPWKVNGTAVEQDTHDLAAVICYAEADDNEDWRDNLYLVAAAPDMLACLEQIELYEPVEDDCAFCGAERYRDGYRHDDDCLGVKIAAVVAKARGK